ncbi:MAG: hypothetical protein JST12_15905 [Armatimonadetes bacterium]|nr:hypothetical protein [Armatimonadota bacterium]
MKFLALFVFSPFFVIGMITGFSGAAKGRHQVAVAVFTVFWILALIVFLALVLRNLKRFGLPPISWKQAGIWAGLWVGFYCFSVALCVVRLGAHRSHWRDLIGIDSYLYLISLPWSAWLMRTKAPAVGELA